MNIASRMETNDTPGENQITRATYDLLKDEFVCTLRGTIEIKGKGPMETCYLVGSRSDGRSRGSTMSKLIVSNQSTVNGAFE